VASNRRTAGHGSHVAGTIGATFNNGYGIAGIDQRAGLLAVRVLGPCGGSQVDINEGMYWAAGGHVPGVPDNPLPARVINMSLGGKGSCSENRQALIDATLARGALVVVSAGNENDNADLYTPASCYGVSTVVATDPYGYRASYSNYSVYADISAPGGDQTRSGDQTDGILSTVGNSKDEPSGVYVFDWYDEREHGGAARDQRRFADAVSGPSLTPRRSGDCPTRRVFASDSVCRTDGDCGAASSTRTTR
jgi:serine protease